MTIIILTAINIMCCCVSLLAWEESRRCAETTAYSLTRMTGHARTARTYRDEAVAASGQAKRTASRHRRDSNH